MKAVYAVIALCLTATGCAKTENRMTLENATGGRLVCKPPAEAPELSDFGRTALVEWCAVACSAHGYRWVGQRYESGVFVADLDLGKRERRAAEKYLPPQCLPFNPGRMGIVATRSGDVPECLGVLFRDGKCPE